MPKMFLLLLLLSEGSLAQPGTMPQTGNTHDEPEEIVVTGERSTLQLRLQLFESEQIAYDIFNQFNDETRFTISCSVQRRTGSNFSDRSCQPEFEIQATRSHAQDYLDSMPGRLDGVPGGSVAQTHSALSMEAEIARHQTAFRQKMKDVAEQHPEFLEAITRYAGLREEYEARTTTAAP